MRGWWGGDTDRRACLCLRGHTCVHRRHHLLPPKSEDSTWPIPTHCPCSLQGVHEIILEGEVRASVGQEGSRGQASGAAALGWGLRGGQCPEGRKQVWWGIAKRPDHVARHGASATTRKDLGKYCGRVRRSGAALLSHNTGMSMKLDVYEETRSKVILYRRVTQVELRYNRV